MAPEILGRPAEEAEALLRAAGVSFTTELTRPTKNFFPVDDAKLYVVRAVTCPDASCRLTLAAKQKKR
ncbi:MAG: aliphatic sulfonate ABC transporter [Schwartzia sp.]|nr:aliphatic sulfonate ABC transporter [Schwartzia sp. (in: firmicutes)]